MAAGVILAFAPILVLPEGFYWCQTRFVLKLNLFGRSAVEIWIICRQRPTGSWWGKGNGRWERKNTCKAKRPFIFIFKVRNKPNHPPRGPR